MTLVAVLCRHGRVRPRCSESNTVAFVSTGGSNSIYAVSKGRRSQSYCYSRGVSSNKRLQDFPEGDQGVLGKRRRRSWPKRLFDSTFRAQIIEFPPFLVRGAINNSDKSCTRDTRTGATAVDNISILFGIREPFSSSHAHTDVQYAGTIAHKASCRISATCIDYNANVACISSWHS